MQMLEWLLATLLATRKAGVRVFRNTPLSMKWAAIVVT